jgi:DNA polymerase III delta prime subunit
MKKRSLLDFIQGSSSLGLQVKTEDKLFKNETVQILKPPNFEFFTENQKKQSNDIDKNLVFSNNDNTLLVDIVRPRTLSGILGHVECKKQVLNFLKEPEKRIKQALLLSGPTGCGKTLLASLAIQEANYEKWDDSILDLSKDSNDVSIEQAIINLSQRKSLSGKPWCAVIECIEGFASEERTSILKAIKTSTIPIIITCDDAYDSSNKVFRESCTHVRMYQNDTNTILRILFKAGEVYGLKLSPETASNILVNSNQNVRLALNTLQLLATTKKTAKKGSALSSADESFNLFTACSRLCAATPNAYEKSLVISSGDSEMFISLLYQNSLSSTSFSNPIMLNVSKLMDSFVQSDLLMNQFLIEEGTLLCSLSAKLSMTVPTPEKQSYFPLYYSIMSSKKSRKDRLSFASGILSELVLGEERPLYTHSSHTLTQIQTQTQTQTQTQNTKKSKKKSTETSFVRDILPDSKLILLSQIRPSGLDAIDTFLVLRSRVNGRNDIKTLKHEGLYITGDPQANTWIQKGIFLK